MGSNNEHLSSPAPSCVWFFKLNLKQLQKLYLAGVTGRSCPSQIRLCTTNVFAVSKVSCSQRLRPPTPAGQLLRVSAFLAIQRSLYLEPPSEADLLKGGLGGEGHFSKLWVSKQHFPIPSPFLSPSSLHFPQPRSIIMQQLFVRGSPSSEMTPMFVLIHLPLRLPWWSSG